MFFKSVTLVASSILMAASVAVAQSLPVEKITPQVEASYAERLKIYQGWKNNLDQLAKEASVPSLTAVARFLDPGLSLVVPVGPDKLQFVSTDDRHVATLLVLLPQDGMRGKTWYDIFNHPHVAANYEPTRGYRGTMTLRVGEKKNLSPRVQALLLGHEGFHAYAAHQRNYTQQNPREFCMEEAVAHRIEIDVLEKIAPQLKRAAQVSARPIVEKLKQTRGQTFGAVQIVYDQTALESALGKEQSELDRGYRATMYTNLVFYTAFSEFFAGDDMRAMERLASVLCAEYRQKGIIR